MVLAVALGSAGCGGGMIPFTHELRTQHNLSDADVKNLQFYVSRTITLRRELESGGRQITGNHKLVLVSGKTIEEVVIEEATPGVAVNVSGRSIAVSFEPGSSMVFSAGAEPGVPVPLAFAEAPEPFPGNSSRRDPAPFPELSGSNGSGSYWLSVESGDRVPYQRTSFTAVGGSLRAQLLIDAESLEEVVESRKVLPGVRLPTH